MVVRYSVTVSAQLARRDGQNENSRLSSEGMSRNIGKLGRTYQKVVKACSASRPGSAVSRHNQIIPSAEIKGKDAINAPSAGARRATSLAIAMVTPEMAAFASK